MAEATDLIDVEPNPREGPSQGAVQVTPTSIERLQAREISAISKLTEPLNESNWTVWKERMKRVLLLCRVDKYATGSIPRPTEVEAGETWDYNDNYAQVIIVSNISSTEMVHVSQCNTASAMWKSLIAVHEAKGHQTMIAVIQNLLHTIAEENSDINIHLNKLLGYWERIALIDDEDFRISDPMFKVIVSSSLPESWDHFTESYVSGRKGIVENDPKKNIRSQEFIGILKEEYLRRKVRANNVGSTNQVIAPRRFKPSTKRIPSRRSNMFCTYCKRDNHNVQDCRVLKRQMKCEHCKKKGHQKKDCWEIVGKPNKRRAEEDQGESNKRQCMNEAAMNVEVNAKEIITFGAEEVNAMDVNEGSEDFDVADPNDERVLYYDWLADSATTAHVTNQREVFETYHPATEATVAGVGNSKIKIEGRGTIQLESQCNGQTFILKLEDVLYIPTNRNSFLSLGRWDDAGGSYSSESGTMLLVKEGKVAAKGIKIRNNLYKLNVRVRKKASNNKTPVTCVVAEENPTWETWHR